MNRFRCLVWLCLCSLFIPAAFAETPRFDAMYVFGDSLSDNGNDLILTKLMGISPAIPPSETPHRTYFQGRFSNGPVAFEYLWRMIRQNANAVVKPSLAFASPPQSGAINYAFGGATSGASNVTPGGFPVPGLLGQVEAFRFGLLGRQAPTRSLFALWIGANDYAATVPGSPEVVVSNIKRAIQRLYQSGARNFLVLNLPDLGLTPVAQGQGVGVALSALSQFHNALLAQAIGDLQSTFPSARIIAIDVFALAQYLLGSTIGGIPALEILEPGTGSCLLLNPVTCTDVPLVLNDPFFYWDVEHPTTYVHGILGRAMYDKLSR